MDLVDGIDKETLAKLLRAGSLVATVLFIVFLPEFTGFPYWDHDYAYLMHVGMPNSSDARWFGDVVGLLTCNEMIPSLALLWAHLFRAAGAVCAVYFFTRSNRLLLLVPGALVIVLSPENLPHYLYRFQTIMYSIPVLLLALGFLIVERGRIRDILFGYICMVCAFGSHPAAVNSAAVLMSGKILFDAAQGHFKAQHTNYARYFLIFSAGITTQFGIAMLLRAAGIADRYNTTNASPREILHNAYSVVVQAFRWFSPFLNQAYEPAFVKFLIATLAVICFIFLLQRLAEGGASRIILGAGMFFATILCSRSAFIITNIYTFHYRVGAFGDTLLQGFFVLFALFLAKGKWVQRVIAVTSAVIICIFISQDFLFQRHTRDQFLVDVLYAQRVVDRIERLDGFDPVKEYQVVFIGSQHYNAKTFWQAYNYPESIEELRRTSMAPWMPEQILKYVAPYLRLRNTPLKSIENAQLRATLELHAKSASWPAKESVALFGDTILCVLDNSTFR